MAEDKVRENVINANLDHGRRLLREGNLTDAESSFRRALEIATQNGTVHADSIREITEALALTREKLEPTTLKGKVEKFINKRAVIAALSFGLATAVASAGFVGYRTLQEETQHHAKAQSFYHGMTNAFTHKEYTTAYHYGQTLLKHLASTEGTSRDFEKNVEEITKRAFAKVREYRAYDAMYNGRLWRARKKPDQAVPWFTQALNYYTIINDDKDHTFDDQIRKTHRALAQAYIEQGEFTKALEDIKKARTDDYLSAPTFLGSYGLLAVQNNENMFEILGKETIFESEVGTPVKAYERWKKDIRAQLESDGSSITRGLLLEGTNADGIMLVQEVATVIREHIVAGERKRAREIMMAFSQSLPKEISESYPMMMALAYLDALTEQQEGFYPGYYTELPRNWGIIEEAVVDPTGRYVAYTIRGRNPEAKKGEKSSSKSLRDKRTILVFDRQMWNHSELPRNRAEFYAPSFTFDGTQLVFTENQRTKTEISALVLEQLSGDKPFDFPFGNANVNITDLIDQRVNPSRFQRLRYPSVDLKYVTTAPHCDPSQKNLPPCIRLAYEKKGTLYVQTKSASGNLETTEIANAHNPMLSKDGTLVYEQGGKIYLRNASDGTTKALPLPETTTNGRPYITLEGNKVFFETRINNNPHRDIALYNMKDDTLINISQTPTTDEALPTANRDGSVVVYLQYDMPEGASPRKNRVIVARPPTAEKL